MERRPQPERGEQHHSSGPQMPDTSEPIATPDAALSWDERVIRDGIQEAANEDRSIDDRTARYIAGQLHSGQASALYALASSGAITDRTMSELVAERAAQPLTVCEWIDALIGYCAGRTDRDAIAGWVEQAEAEDRADLMERIAEGSVATLGDMAVIHAPPETSESADSEHDTFPWGDAARWSPEGAGIGMLTDAELDSLLDTVPDEEIGDADELGWHGLIRADDRPGGYIVVQYSSGTHQVLECATDNALTEAWANITSDYERYYAEREAYENATAEAGDGHRGIGPQIWVGSLADYNSGYLHGEWFDATCDAEELQLATQFMLRSSRTQGAEEWAVMDYDGFGPLHLGEYVSFETISRIANGIAAHGEAFAAWATHVGPEEHDALGCFEDHYRGEWESFEAYIEDYLQESDFYHFLDYVPEDMRGYIEVDVEQIARDWSADYEVVERPEGGVWVFETRV